MNEYQNKVELTFFPPNIEPTEDSKILFFEFGELKTGSFFDGRFYHDGSIHFPSCWAYAPEEPNVEP